MKKAIPVDSKNVSLVEGDVLSTTCVYDTTGRSEATIFGLSTYDEMCLNALGAELDTEADEHYGQAFSCEGSMWSGDLDAQTFGMDIHANRTLIEQATKCWTLTGSRVDCMPLKAQLTVINTTSTRDYCCLATTLACLACKHGLTVKAYCAKYPGKLDCIMPETTQTNRGLAPNGSSSEGGGRKANNSAETNKESPQSGAQSGNNNSQVGTSWSAGIPEPQKFLGFGIRGCPNTLASVVVAVVISYFVAISWF